MNVVYLLLYIDAALCFALVALGVNSRVNLLASGLFAWVLVPLLHAIVALNR